MRHLLLPLLCAQLLACGNKDDDESEGTESQDSTDDTDDSDDDTGDSNDDTGGDNQTGATAGLKDLSDGECPDMDSSGSTSFSSSDEERDVRMVIPSQGTEGARVVFFFHGLDDPSHTDDPTEAWASALDLQGLADDTHTVFILPISNVYNIGDFGIPYDMDFYMWDVIENSGTDVVLYDDLRTCASNELSVDLENLHVMGFSGGAIFTAVIGRDRGDTIASVVSMSGGADQEALGYEVAEYETAAYQYPAVVISGGSQDVWPSPSYAVFNFEEASDDLEELLADDGHFVVRCKHDNGHTLTWDMVEVAEAWILNHTYGADSPFESEGIDDWSDWCEVVSAD